VKLRHSLEHGALVAVALVFKAVPRRLALSIGAGLGWLFWTVRLRRGIVLENIAQAMPEASLTERKRIAARAARNFGRTAGEFFRFGGRDRERTGELVSIAGDDELRAVLAEGRGAIVVTGHLGAWALYVAAIAIAGIPTSLLIGRQSNPRVHDFIRSLPGEHLTFISQRKTAPRALLQSLADGKALVLVADQHAGGRGTVAPFFGRETFTMALPAALIGRRGTALFGMFGHRVEEGRHALTIERLAVPDVDGEDKAWRRRRIATLCNESIARAALDHPDQYFWYHRRYRPTAPPGPL